MDVDNTRHATYRTLESISSRYHQHHHHQHLHSHQPLNSWKQHLLADDIENASMYVVDEIEDECFHTSDFEPFSDDEELELANRLMSIEGHYQCSSDISSLDYALFEPLKPTVVVAKKYESGYRNGNRFCSGIMYLSASVNVSSGLAFVIVDGVTLSALNDSLHALQLYAEIANEAKPDITITSAKKREQICKDICRSGFFSWVGLAPIDASEKYRHGAVFPRDFKVDSSHNFREYVFACWLKEAYEGGLVLIYVSKEYNVGTSIGPRMPGRFIFVNPMPQYPRSHYLVVLAEEPAKVYMESDRDLELYYLRIRKIVETAESDGIDPLCRLVSEKILDFTNQHYRFCVAVSRSSQLRRKIRYPGQVPRSCVKQEVSFRTVEAVQEAGGKSYWERMTQCHSGYVRAQNGDNQIFISRGYTSNEIFVFRLDPSDGKMYLENLSIGVSILDQLNSFDFLED